MSHTQGWKKIDEAELSNARDGAPREKMVRESCSHFPGGCFPQPPAHAALSPLFSRQILAGSGVIFADFRARFWEQVDPTELLSTAMCA